MLTDEIHIIGENLHTKILVKRQKKVKHFKQKLVIWSVCFK